MLSDLVVATDMSEALRKRWDGIACRLGSSAAESGCPRHPGIRRPQFPALGVCPVRGRSVATVQYPPRTRGVSQPVQFLSTSNSRDPVLGGSAGCGRPVK